MTLAAVLSLLLASAPDVAMCPLTADDTTEDLVSHPAFADFGRLAAAVGWPPR